MNARSLYGFGAGWFNEYRLRGYRSNSRRAGGFGNTKKSARWQMWHQSAIQGNRIAREKSHKRLLGDVALAQ